MDHEFDDIIQALANVTEQRHKLKLELDNLISTNNLLELQCANFHKWLTEADCKLTELTGIHHTNGAPSGIPF